MDKWRQLCEELAAKGLTPEHTKRIIEVSLEIAELMLGEEVAN